MKTNDSPEIPDRGQTSDIPGLPSGRGRGEKTEGSAPKDSNKNAFNWNSIFSLTVSLVCLLKHSNPFSSPFFWTSCFGVYLDCLFLDSVCWPLLGIVSDYRFCWPSSAASWTSQLALKQPAQRSHTALCAATVSLGVRRCSSRHAENVSCSRRMSQLDQTTVSAHCVR